MQRKKVIVVSIVIVLCILVVIGVAFYTINHHIAAKNSEVNKESSQQSGELSSGDNLEAESSKTMTNSDESMSYAKSSSKVFKFNGNSLDNSFVYDMNQEISCKSPEGATLSFSVTDAKLLRDISYFNNLLEKPYYLEPNIATYANPDGTFTSGYYYLVVTVKVTNVGSAYGECLMPGMFSYGFMAPSEMQPSSDGSGAMNSAVKLDGSARVTAKGLLTLQPGESSTFALITTVQEADVSKDALANRDCYLITNASSMKWVPKDTEKVRFVCLHF